MNRLTTRLWQACKLLLWTGLWLLLLFVALVLLAGFNIWQAEKTARAFCAKVQVGETLEAVRSRAGGEVRVGPVLTAATTDETAQNFYVRGFLFYSVTCKVRARQGRVIETDIIVHD